MSGVIAIPIWGNRQNSPTDYRLFLVLFDLSGLWLRAEPPKQHTTFLFAELDAHNSGGIGTGSRFEFRLAQVLNLSSEFQVIFSKRNP